MASPTIAHHEARRIRFSYPATWTPEVREVEGGTSIALQSPDVTFAIVGIYDAELEPATLVEEAIASLREEHPGLEVEELFDEWVDTITFELVFISLDTVSYCWLRSWRLAGQSLLVMVQSIEPESTASRRIFEAICESVREVNAA